MKFGVIDLTCNHYNTSGFAVSIRMAQVIFYIFSCAFSGDTNEFKKFMVKLFFAQIASD